MEANPKKVESAGATATDFERRVLATTSLALAGLGLLTALAFPALAGFDPLHFSNSALATLGFAIAWLLARRGHVHAASNLLLGVLTLVVLVAAILSTNDSIHHIMPFAWMVPMGLAFALERVHAARALTLVVAAYLAFHFASLPHGWTEMAAVTVILTASVAAAGIAPTLRRLERKRADAAEATGRQAQEDAQRLAAELEASRQVARMRADFLNMAAHDLRTPLTPLKLALATVKRAPGPDPGQARRIEVIERNIQRLEGLIDDVLDASRMDSGRLRLRLQDTDLAAIVRDAAAQVQPAAEAAGLALTVEVPAEARLRADGLRLLQVANNLLSNAVRYSPGGGRVTVRLGSTLDAGGGPAWRLEVEDPGLGLTPEQKARLFRPFSRVHDGTNVPKGTGLGLHISKGLVEQHGGTMGVESPGPGQGCTFHATFPVAGPVQAAQEPGPT